MTKSLPHFTSQRHVLRAGPRRGLRSRTNQLLLLVAVGRTAFLYDLAFARDGKTFGGNIVSDRGAGGNKSSLADSNRRNQGAVGSDERVVFDVGFVFLRAVVVGGNDAGADIDVLPDRGVADISQMSGFRAATEPRFLDLDKVADLDRVFKSRRPFEGARTDRRKRLRRSRYPRARNLQAPSSARQSGNS